MYRMEDGRIPKDLLYGELESGSRPIGRPKLPFKEICAREICSPLACQQITESYMLEIGVIGGL